MIIFNKSGIALLLVLWVLILLSVIVGEFCYTTRTELNITRNFKEETETLYIATAGMYATIAALLERDEDAVNDSQKAVDQDKTVTVTQEDGDQTNDPRNWRINAEIAPIPFGNGAYQVRIENESGKININHAPPELLKRIFSRFELDDETLEIIIDSIQDWRDKDNLHRINGAEDDYYLALDPPYECKDDYFTSIEELLLVRGIDKTLFYNGIEDVVTVFPGETEDINKRDKRDQSNKNDKNQFDFSHININAAYPEMWRCLPEMTEAFIENILLFREEKDFENQGELSELLTPEVFGAILPYITLQTLPYYTIRSEGKLPESRSSKTIAGIVKIDKQIGGLPVDQFEIIQWDEVN